MKRLLALLLLIPNLAFAQITQQEVLNAIANNLPTNNANEISALLLRNTLDVMTSAIFQGVPIQTGTACPPLTGLIPFQFFANTTSVTDTKLNLFDGTACIKFANINQTTHTMGFVGSSLVTAPTGDSFVDITSAGTKTAVDIYSPFSSMGGTEFDVGRFVLDFEGTNTGTVSQANALGAYAYCNFNSQAASYPSKGNCTSLSGFSIAANTGANAWGIVAFCADNFTSAPYVGGNRSCTHEFDIRIEDTTGTARGTGALLNLVGNGTTSSTLIAADIQNNAATLKWNFGVNCNNNAVLNACINVGTQNTGVSGSQNLAFEYNFTGSAQKAMTMTTPSTGGFVFTTSDAAINVGFDWSAVTFNQCAFKMAYGCTINGSGNGLFTSIITNVANAALTQGNIINQQPAGSVSTTINGNIDYFNGAIITNWNVRDTGGGTGIFAGNGTQLFVNGSSAYTPNGTFAYAVDIQTFTIAPSSIGTTNQYGGIISRGIVQTSIPSGVNGYGLTGINANMVISSGVSGVAAIGGFESDMTVIGSAPLSRYGYTTVLGPTDATQGSVNDASFYWTLAAASVSPGWHNIFLLNPPSGTKLLDSGGCIFCVAGAVQTIATGFDFHTWTVSGFAFRSPNFFVNGAGVSSVSALLVNTTTITAGVNAQIHAGTNANIIFVNNGGTIQAEAINDAINTLEPWILTASNWSINASGNAAFGNMTLTSAAPTVAAAQIGYGSTVVAAGSGNCPTGTVGTKTVAGCIVMNVAGSTAVVPYF